MTAFKVSENTVFDFSRNGFFDQLSVGNSTLNSMKGTTAVLTDTNRIFSLNPNNGNYFKLESVSNEPEIVGSVIYEHTSSTTTNYNLPAGIQEGDFLYLVCSIKSPGFGMPTVTSWTNLGTNFVGTYGMGAFSFSVGSFIPSTVEVGPVKGDYQFLMIVALRNVGGDGVKDVTSAYSGNPNHQAVSINAVPNIVTIFAYMQNQNTTLTAPAGYTILQSDTSNSFIGSVAIATKTVTTIGTEDSGPFGGATGEWISYSFENSNPEGVTDPSISLATPSSSTDFYSVNVELDNISANNVNVIGGNIEWRPSNPLQNLTGGEKMLLNFSTWNGGTDWKASKVDL